MKVSATVLFSRSGWLEETERPLYAIARYCLERLAPSFAARGHELDINYEDWQSETGRLKDIVKEAGERQDWHFFFGPYTSIHRKVVQQHLGDYSLLFYPTQYEGFDQDPKTWFFGGLPNQQLIPTLEWFARLPGVERTAAFIGSDYRYPKMVQAILHDSHYNTELTVLVDVLISTDEESEQDVKIRDFIDTVGSTEPGLVINAINGSANDRFFKAIHQSRVSNHWPTSTRVVSLSLSDVELSQYSTEATAGGEGTLIAGNFFDSLLRVPTGDLAKLRLGFLEWLVNAKTDHPDLTTVPPILSDAMVNVANSIQFWSSPFLSAEDLAEFDTSEYLRADIKFAAPDGSHLAYYGMNRHGRKRFYLGTLDSHGRIRSVEEPLRGKVHRPQPLLDPKTGAAIRRVARMIDARVPVDRFSLKVERNEISYPESLSKLFNENWEESAQIHELNDIAHTATVYLTTSEKKTQWRSLWQPLADAIKKLHCGDRDIVETLELWQSREFRDHSRRMIAMLTCKLRAIYYRRLPDRVDAQRVYLFDALHNALSNRASISLHEEKCVSVLALFDWFLDRGILNCHWEIKGLAISEVLRLIQNGKLEHKVTVADGRWSYRMWTHPDPKETVAEMKLVVPGEALGGTAATVERLRLFVRHGEELVLTYPLPIRTAKHLDDSWWPIDRYIPANNPACVIQVQKVTPDGGGSGLFHFRLTGAFGGVVANNADVHS